MVQSQEFGLEQGREPWGWDIEAGRRKGKYVSCVERRGKMTLTSYWSVELEVIRGGALELQRPREKDEDRTMGQFLFGDGEMKRRRRVPLEMWRARERVVGRCAGEAAGRRCGSCGWCGWIG